MVSVNGYFDGSTCVAEDTSRFRLNQRLVITALDEDFNGTKISTEKQSALNELHSIFGAMTHEEAEDIRNHRINFKERF